MLKIFDKAEDETPKEFAVRVITACYEEEIFAEKRWWRMAKHIEDGNIKSMTNDEVYFVMDRFRGGYLKEEEGERLDRGVRI